MTRRTKTYTPGNALDDITRALRRLKNSPGNYDADRKRHVAINGALRLLDIKIEELSRG